MTGPGDGFDEAALDRARVDGYSWTLSEWGAGTRGVALFADLLDRVTSLPFAAFRWAALEGVAAALTEVARQE